MAKYKRLSGYDAPTGSASELVGVNDSGVAVGNYSFDIKEHGYLVTADDTQRQQIDYPESVTTSLVGIDNSNDVFGNYSDANSDERGFARAADGTVFDLDDALPADARGSPATITAASRSGEVTGLFSENGAQHIFTAKLTSRGFENFTRLELNPISLHRSLRLRSSWRIRRAGRDR